MGKPGVINGRFKDAGIADATATSITDNSGGTASGSATIAAIGASYSQTEVRNAIATLAAELNAAIADIAAIRSNIND